MKKRLLFTSLLCLCICLNAVSQIIFEKGYIIDSLGNKKAGLIKNMVWKENPKEIIFKLNSDQAESTLNVKNIKEFGVYGYPVYRSFELSIDRSSDDPNRLDRDKNPKWSKEHLFLQLLVTGEKANLYYYIGQGNIRFFYSKNDTSVEQLVYKKYIYTSQNLSDISYGSPVIMENETFRQQIWNYLKTEELSKFDLQHLFYKKKDLVKYFLKYNNIQTSKLKDSTQQQNKYSFHLRPILGINNTYLNITNSIDKALNVSFDNKIIYSLGLNAELVLPFNKNKWAVFCEPTFQKFKASSTLFYINERDASLIYKTIELPIGVRYYLYLSPNNKLFLDFIYSPYVNMNFDSKFEISGVSSYNIKYRGGFSGGLGFDSKRISGEIRYAPNKNIFDDYLYWKSDFDEIFFLIGFKIF